MPRRVNFSQILQQLQKNAPLKLLDLSGQELSASKVKELAEALKQNTSLTSLNLAANTINSEGATEIAKALIQNTSLTSLNLGYNAIGKEGATVVAEALMENKSLTSLDLGYNPTGKEGATVIVQTLVRMIKLKEKAFVLKLIDIARIGKLTFDIFKMIGHTAAKNIELQRKPQEIECMISLVYSNVCNRFNNALTAEEKKWRNDWNGKQVFCFPPHSQFFSSPPTPFNSPPLPPMTPQKASAEESIDKSQPPSALFVIQ